MNKIFFSVLFTMFLISCVSFPETKRIKEVNGEGGYRYSSFDKTNNKEDLFVILTFSGGGTRASALSLGVLEGLKDTWVMIDGEKRNLLKEIDVISSVSGGSFTAAYYGLNGDEIFDDNSRFKNNFLYHDVERSLKFKLFNPYNWYRLASPTFSRVDIADEYYQDILFDDSKFKKLLNRKNGPFIIINATDMAKGSQFNFIQSQFDPMCLNLNYFPISRAVAASASYPILLSPVTLNSYPNTCNYHFPEWAENALKSRRYNTEKYYEAKRLKSYEENERKYVHLLDGGVSDNIGLRYPINALTSENVDWSILRKNNNKTIKKLLIVVVDAKRSVKKDFDESAVAPYIRDVIENIADTPLSRYSVDSVNLMRQSLYQIYREKKSENEQKMESYIVYVGFDKILSDSERMEFNNIETSFTLPRNEVNMLIKKGRDMLKDSSCIKKLEAGVSDYYCDD